MGTQFHRLTTPHAWGTEAVQVHLAWNLEAQHVVSQARAAREDSRGFLDQGPIDVCGLGSKRLILTFTIAFVLKSALRRDHSPAVGLASGASRDLTLTLTRQLTGTLH